MNGERHPGDVYKDFRTAVMRVLGQQDNPPVFANGRVAAVPADVSTEQIPTRVSDHSEPSHSNSKPPNITKGTQNDDSQHHSLFDQNDEKIQHVRGEAWPEPDKRRISAVFA